MSTTEFLSRLADLGIQSLSDVLPTYEDSRTTEDERQKIRENIRCLNFADSVPFCLSLLTASDFDLVRQSSLALAQIGSKRATRSLIRILRHSPLWHSRVFAAEALMHLRDERAILPLVAVVRDLNEDERVRDEAAEALSVFIRKRPQRVIPALLRVADDASAWVRWSVAFALGHATDIRVIPALQRLARDGTVLPGGQVSIAAEATEALENVRDRLTKRRRRH
jgi:HEAT repeat protein